VGDIDQRQFQLFVDLLELPPQMPFQMGIDDGQGFIEEHGRHIASHQAASQGYFLFGIGAQARGFFIQVRVKSRISATSFTRRVVSVG
jgi:hypothetical protein